jgi:cytosine deaminase
MANLLIRDARLVDGGRFDVSVVDGRIEALTPVHARTTSSASFQTIDCGGDLLVPGFVDGHIHLDKTFVGLPWMSNEAGLGIAERVAYEREMERRISYPVAARAGALIEKMVARGTTLIRTHVDIDPIDRLKRLEGMLEARERYRGIVDVQIVAFPQMGVVSRPGMVDLLDAALAAGADVLGGIDPGTVDGDVTGQLDALFALAEKRAVGLDLHLHVQGSLGIHELEQVAKRTAERGMGGRVVASHAHSLGGASPDVAQATADRLASAGVSVFTYGPGWIPLPPLAMLAAAGVTVFAGSDNVRDAWQPYGTGDMLERAWIVAYRSAFRRDAEFRLAWDMATTNAAHALGIPRHGVAVGNAADLVVLSAENVAEAICNRPVRRYVIKGGRVVARDGVYVGS